MELLLVVSFSALAWIVFILVKASNTGKAHSKILYAIDKYTVLTHNYTLGMAMIEAMENFDTTVYRFWDWGYKNILPKEYFEIIEPYID